MQHTIVSMKALTVEAHKLWTRTVANGPNVNPILDFVNDRGLPSKTLQLELDFRGRYYTSLTGRR
jgi:hypothetical protein